MCSSDSRSRGGRNQSPRQRKGPPRALLVILSLSASSRVYSIMDRSSFHTFFVSRLTSQPCRVCALPSEQVELGRRVLTVHQAIPGKTILIRDTPVADAGFEVWLDWRELSLRSSAQLTHCGHPRERKKGHSTFRARLVGVRRVSQNEFQAHAESGCLLPALTCQKAGREACKQ